MIFFFQVWEVCVKLQNVSKKPRPGIDELMKACVMFVFVSKQKALSAACSARLMNKVCLGRSRANLS